jgi:hypothetical protein
VTFVGDGVRARADGNSEPFTAELEPELVRRLRRRTRTAAVVMEVPVPIVDVVVAPRLPPIEVPAPSLLLPDASRVGARGAGPRERGGGAGGAASGEPELVVTETMAEIFLQGDTVIALAVYAQLAQRDPGNYRIAAYSALRRVALRRRRRAEALPRFAARETGGRPVASAFPGAARL